MARMTKTVLFVVAGVRSIAHRVMVWKRRAVHDATVAVKRIAIGVMVQKSKIAIGVMVMDRWFVGVVEVPGMISARRALPVMVLGRRIVHIVGVAGMRTALSVMGLEGVSVLYATALEKNAVQHAVVLGKSCAQPVER